jgi:hypothetical protein
MRNHIYRLMIWLMIVIIGCHTISKNDTSTVGKTSKIKIDSGKLYIYVK